MSPKLRAKARESHLKRTFGITTSQYTTILKSQGGKCGVCKRPARQFKKRLAVDHDHKTKRIRGLLCIHCNRYVIGRHRDPDLFANASEYLRQGTDHYVPDRPKRRRRRKTR
jgi:hypothetical protein